MRDLPPWARLVCILVVAWPVGPWVGLHAWTAVDALAAWLHAAFG